MVVVDGFDTGVASRLQAEDKMLAANVDSGAGMLTEELADTSLFSIRSSHAAHFCCNLTFRFRFPALVVTATSLVVVVVVYFTGIVV